MPTDLGLLPLDVLRNAVKSAFAERRELDEVRIDGTLMQAWQAYSHLLGVSEHELARRLAPFYGVSPAADLSHSESPALALVPFAFCQSHLILPLRIENGRLLVAGANPHDTDLTERLAFMADRRVNWLLAAPREIDDALATAFTNEAKHEMDRLGIHDGRVVALNLDENAIVKLGRTLMADSITQRASDLHIQPFLGAFVARIRVDGVLRRLTILPEAVAVTLIRHVKARSGMDPTNSMIPQDGRLSAVVDGQEFDMRVSTLPSVRGERLVIRFLDQTRVNRLSGAGFSLAALQTLRRIIARPSGMVILTGPTGSGKTSTLYAMLAEINHPGVNIITAENPVEYRIPGISQVDVNEKAGRSFANVLRSILRQDPDVILIGEIRDTETAEIATQAALTGHLVLSTLHTNDAITAIPRLLNLGVAPTTLADSLVAVASQRLCRKLCTHCRVPVSEPLAAEEQAFREVTHNLPAYRRVGCAHCDFTGFRGRLPIVDIIEINSRLRDAIAMGEARLSALDELREGGLKSLAVSGSLRVISGDTTVREVMDSVGPSFWKELAAHYGSYYSADHLEAIPVNAAQGHGILLLSRDQALAAQLTEHFAAQDMRLIIAGDAQTADALLRKDEDICFLVKDAPPDSTVESFAAYLKEARRQLAWSRLPTAILIPPSLESATEDFRSTGATAAFLVKPVDPAQLLARIRRTQAR